MPPRRAKDFKRELSAGAVIFRNGIPRRYLLLEYESAKEYWGFPKGIVEKGERPQETARREIKEETGLLKVLFVDGFQERVHYFFHEGETLISKDVIYFLAEVPFGDVSISPEHKGFGWFPYDEAREKLTYNKETLEAAETALRKRYGA